MPNMQPAGAKRIAQWRDTLERATTFDAWGQLVEAVDEYESLSRSIGESLGSDECQFADEPLRFLNRLMIVINLRAKSAQDLTSESPLKLEDLKTLVPVLKNLPSDCPSEFPIQVKGLRQQLDDPPMIVPKVRRQSVSEKPPQRVTQPTPATPAAAAASAQPPPGGDDDDDDDGDAGQARGGGLKPRRRLGPGQTNVTLRVEKIQLKDPGQYFDPFIAMTVVDANGTILESQQTPPTKMRDEFVHFNQDIELQLALEELPPGMAVFFEFKHYKPKKQKTSVKCFCFMEQDEIKNGTFPLEIYQKPTDLKRKKKLVLLTERPHYLYVTVTLHEN